jgi:hypothetical protein
MITLSTTIIGPPPTNELDFDAWRATYITKTNANAIATGLLHACQHSRAVAMTRYKPALGSVLGAPVFLDCERDAVFLAQPPPPTSLPSIYEEPFTEEDLKVLQHLAFHPTSGEWFDISLSEIPRLKTVIFPSDGGKALYLRLETGKYIIHFLECRVDRQIQQECFERRFEELLRTSRRELGLDESDQPKILWMSKAELESKVENEKVFLKSRYLSCPGC